MLTMECAYFALMAIAVFVAAGYPASYFIVRMLTESTNAYTCHFTLLPLALGAPPLIIISLALPSGMGRAVSRSSVVERLREAE
jgi:hypothetical protein